MNYHMRHFLSRRFEKQCDHTHDGLSEQTCVVGSLAACTGTAGMASVIMASDALLIEMMAVVAVEVH
jgi:hypothetical protein